MRLAQLLIRLYPREWRQRYGVEFAGLLEESGVGWSEFLDVGWNAMKVRMQTKTARIPVLLGLAGLAIGSVVAYRMPNTYQSTAVLLMPSEAGDKEISKLQGSVLSRRSLSGIIQEVGLYESERRSQPLEDVIEQMKHDIRIANSGVTSHGRGLSISFANSDPARARRTVQRLLMAFIDTNFQQKTTTLLVADPPNLPSRPLSPNRWVVCMAGLGLGLLAGLALLGARRWPFVAASGLVGATVAFAISLAIPDRYISSVVIVTGDPAASAEVVKFVLSNPDALARVLKEAGPDSKKGDLSVSKAGPGTLEVRVIAERPELARAGAGRLAGELQMESTQRQLIVHKLGNPEPSMEVVDPAHYPESPTWPNRPVIGMLGLVCGLLLAAGVRVVRRPAPAIP